MLIFISVIRNNLAASKLFLITGNDVGSRPERHFCHFNSIKIK